MIWMVLAVALAQGPEPISLPEDPVVPAIGAPEGEALVLPEAQAPEDPEPITFDEPLQVGQESLVVLTDPFGRPERGATVQVVYAPGMHRERIEAIGITDSRGRISWAPAEAGLAILKAGDEERVVAVAWTSPRPDTVSALVMLLLAGLLMSGYGVLPRRRRKKTA